MWNDRLRLVESVERDWRALPEGEREGALEALRTIDDDPIAGAPLLDPLAGLWSYRAGSLRIIYRIVTEGRYVLVLSISRSRPSRPPDRSGEPS